MNKLKEIGIKTVYVVGLALDYCVGSTAIDAKEAGFDVWVIEEATKPVAKETGDKMIDRFNELGIHYKKLKEVEIKV